MYTSDDGLNHQANMSFQIDISSMEVLYSAYEVANVLTGYVSHSFDQYITVDDGEIVALDPSLSVTVIYTFFTNDLPVWSVDKPAVI